MLDQFREWFEKRHEYAREWKRRTGGKVVGYLCTYAPEEILYAAGILPIRLYGIHEVSAKVEPHIFASMFCPFCRDVLGAGLEGYYDYVDGIVIAQSCLHMRQAFWSWQKHLKPEFSYYIYMPHCVQSAGRYEYLRGELAAFKEAVEKWIGKKITDEDLDRAIEVYNTNRRLLWKMQELRKLDEPPILGFEAKRVIISSQLVDKADHNKAMEELLKELPNRKLDRETGSRLMIVGSPDEVIEFSEMVETQLTLPATIVVEEECTGVRYFWNEVQLEEDRLMALAKRYLNRLPCPQKDWPERTRFPKILELAREYKVDGVLLEQQKFCDPHELDIRRLKEYLEKNGLPTYFLEFDIIVPVGQFRTRVEAFLETMVGII